MSDRLLVSTRKGLFVVRRLAAGWAIDPPHFLGDSVTLALVDRRDGAWYAALNLGHFGVKLRRSDERRVPVDGRLVVTRTRNGGRSFDVLRNGLPQLHAYDLVYRHGLDIDASGSCLAFGSTTGGLWSSDDQGDCWQTLSTSLPPIHAVRFA